MVKVVKNIKLNYYGITFHIVLYEGLQKNSKFFAFIIS